MKKNDLVEIKKIDLKSLQERIKKSKSEFLDLKMDKNMNKLTNLKLVKNKRRDIAQMLTILSQKQLLQQLESKEPREGKTNGK